MRATLKSSTFQAVEQELKLEVLEKSFGQIISSPQYIEEIVCPQLHQYVDIFGDKGPNAVPRTSKSKFWPDSADLSVCYCMKTEFEGCSW